MVAPASTPIRSLVKKVVVRTALGVVTAQAATIGGLVAYDALTKSQRKTRSGFPRPGRFGTDVASSDVDVFTFGADLYDDMIEKIDAAERNVFLETYLWKGDEYGQKFLDAVNRAARRGLDVRVIYDGFGNLVVPSKFYRFDPAVKVYRVPVLRPELLTAPIRTTGVNHRKVLVVDDDTAYVGGYNLGSTYATTWRDTHLRVCGPDSWALRQSFATVWNGAAGKHDKVPRLDPPEWDSRVRVWANTPFRLVYPIRSMYLQAIDRATHHIYISTPYFIPDHQILNALIRAQERGVDVRIMVPMDSNHVLADWASRGFYVPLLRAGVTLLLYKNAMIHAKTATIDGVWSTVGTANIDRLSLSFNYEVNLEIIDNDLAAVMERVFEVDSSNSQRLSLEEWEDRHPLAWVAELAIAPFRSFL
ncbi:phosphatidylserine/phosphatidylglycerophosphate/cardiolipin synthase family protein [Kocuria coralli]|uniref:Phosphatidylserine/phosphatidylglycerophosphate/ cardiolipin synthase family protein n=1 Tax=Kocuria coralli TaxID=1461025 RepID=A0A5J5KXX6_9MICC|nr:phosphatidylserine/phosphatidylglycerophosphate/cardiolipin synthase family protein [Kocuria coralli]KAA9394278.1 phosphatidylserine/phosphatidylglycerophosphate/cardiolipin synthase family protein [Kocuria coralli]